MKILYTHRLDYDNPGDLWSSPSHYLGPKYVGITADVWHLPAMQCYGDWSAVIVGGGGIMQDRDNIDRIRSFLSRTKIQRRMIWGAGINPDIVGMDDIADAADLFGCRDWLPGTRYEKRWVPCVSVLRPEFEIYQTYRPQKDFLVIDHFKRKPIDFAVTHTRMLNSPQTLAAMIQAVADHRYVISSSYHACYWASLLKRAAIYISRPYVKKCETMKYPPVMAHEFSWRLLDQVQIYERAFADCRDTSREFMARAKAMLKKLDKDAARPATAVLTSSTPTQDVIPIDGVDHTGSP